MSPASVVLVTDPDVEELLRRVTDGRDFAQARARELFAEIDKPRDGSPSSVVLANSGATYRAIGRVLNVVLGLDPDEGYPPPY
jgi:hypothetical protein